MLPIFSEGLFALARWSGSSFAQSAGSKRPKLKGRVKWIPTEQSAFPRHCGKN